MQLESDGSGSTLNINVLTSIQGNVGQQYYSGLQATNHGRSAMRRSSRSTKRI